MARMTDEEADALDEYYTQNTIMPDGGKPGFFARRKKLFIGVDPVTAVCLRAKSDATRDGGVAGVSPAGGVAENREAVWSVGGSPPLDLKTAGT